MRSRATALGCCRYCGCTEENSCAIPSAMLRELGAPPGTFVPCGWVAPNVCSAPTCVAAAYRALASVGDSDAQVFAGR